MSGHTWAPGEQDAAFVAYCLARGGAVPTFAAVCTIENAAAIALGAGSAQGDPLTRREVIAAVEAALSESSEAEGGDGGEAIDAALAGLAGYAEGVGDMLTALEEWLRPTPPGTDAGFRTFFSRREGEEVMAWLSARRSAAPQRPLSAPEVLDRIEAWVSSGFEVKTGQLQAPNQNRTNLRAPSLQ